MKNSLIREYLRGLLPEIDFASGFHDDDRYPDRHVDITPVQGPGMVIEWAYEVAAFQIRAVGDQFRGDPEAAQDDAEDLAFEVDQALLGGTWPRQIGGLKVQWIKRAGGGPSLLEMDDADRAHMVCTYLIEIQSGY